MTSNQGAFESTKMFSIGRMLGPFPVPQRDVDVRAVADIERFEGFRNYAANDSDLNAIRDEPAFKELVG